MDESVFDCVEIEEEPIQSPVFQVVIRDYLECLSGDAYDAFVRKIIGRLDVMSISALGCTSTYWRSTIGDPNRMFDAQAYEEESRKDAELEQRVQKCHLNTSRWEDLCTKLIIQHRDMLLRHGLKILEREKHEREMLAYSTFWNKIIKKDYKSAN